MIYASKQCNPLLSPQVNPTTHPHPIPAVRAIIEDAQSQVLLLQRANTAFGQGSWCLPGGKIDYGQTVEEALAAEIAEELSLQLQESTFFFYQNSLPDVPGGPHYLNLYFHCRTAGEIRLNEESSAYAWVGILDFEQYPIVFRNDEAIRRHFAGRQG